MLFHIAYEVSVEQRNASQKRFKETGAPPPDGVTMTGRWHSLGGRKGVAVVEASDPQAIASWIQDWNDVVTFEVTPVLTDEQFAQVLG